MLGGQVPGTDGALLVVADFSEPLHFALFVRDAFALEIDDLVHIPPRLVRQAPDLSTRIDPYTRSSMAVQWIDWWERTVQGVVENTVSTRTHLARLAVGAIAQERARFLAEAGLRYPTVDGEVTELDETFRAAWIGWRKGTQAKPQDRRASHNEWYEQVRKWLSYEGRRSRGTGKQFVVAMIMLEVGDSWIQHVAPGVVLHSPGALESKGRLDDALLHACMSARDYLPGV